MTRECNEALLSHLDPSSKESGAGVFSLPNLQSLHLIYLTLDDDWFSGMASVATNAQIKELSHLDADLGSVASLEYARGIFSMPSLQTLKLNKMKLADEFFSTMAELSSQSQITKLTISRIIVSATREFAKGIFSLPCLQSLTLVQNNLFAQPSQRQMQLDESFFSIMAELSAQSPLKDLCHKNAKVGPSLSREYSRAVFSMPHLHSFTLQNVRLDDEFFSTMAVKSMHSQIRDLRIDRIFITQRILRTLLTIPHLHSLTLCRIMCRKPTEISPEMTAIVPNSVTTFGVDTTSIRLLCQWDLHMMCPSIKTITLHVDERADTIPDIPVEFLHFPQLMELNICKDDGPPALLNTPTSFHQSVISSCPHINKLSMSNFAMGNEMATVTIQSMMAHEQLTNIQLIRCGTDKELHELIAEIKEQGRLTVVAEHGKPREEDWRNL